MSTRLSSAKNSQPPRSSSDRMDAAIQELRRGTRLADLLRQQVELIPELERRHAAVANVGEISTAMESSLSLLQSEMERPPSPEVEAVAMAACSSDGGTGERNGAVARARRMRHRRGRHGAELPMKEILTEAPENDRFHWRKYGEKNILNAEYPRLYYKCGYSDDHKCPAKKYVQQQSNSGPTPLFMVTLINEHTCETLFPNDPCSSSSSASQVLDFTKASLSPPVMAAAAPGLKKEEEDSMSVSMHRQHSYPYDEYLSSSFPTMSPDGDHQVKFSPGPGW
ncbi:probable WRKY transcription factor 70 [Panicum virgatum]|uniref:WRKY domain-containing protein n=1 Tax=Panicum virgatum TaxID=38727 RepID=A0A8T0UVG3_PANVG|nr:probable WRKY transcription factor 70 [Panicum virgatum]XP_039837850.1 probable WRKY transcription factor 70 [Panicum virgatum]KAG2481264.1 hypothetical protein PVAP13_J683632 [Panicum virgatum]KAG2626800.1 hypothetical protein PVAP13_3KG377839 [Panicum virgatum]